MEELYATALIEAGVLAVIVGALIQVLKKALPSDFDKERWLPVISMSLGILLGVIYAIVTNGDMLVYVTSGILSGGFASGAYDMLHGQTKGE